MNVYMYNEKNNIVNIISEEDEKHCVLTGKDHFYVSFEQVYCEETNRYHNIIILGKTSDIRFITQYDYLTLIIAHNPVIRHYSHSKYINRSKE